MYWQFFFYPLYLDSRIETILYLSENGADHLNLLIHIVKMKTGTIMAVRIVNRKCNAWLTLFKP